MKGKRLLIALALLFLTTWGFTLFLLRGTVAYALSSPEVLALDRSTDLSPHDNRFVQVTGTPDHNLAVAYRRYGVPSYWYPLVEYDARLLVKADSPLARSTGSSAQQFQGRLRPMQRVAFSSHVTNRFLQERGLRLPPDSYVVAIGEPPQTFLPMLALGAPVTVAWLGVLIAMGALGTHAFTRRRPSSPVRRRRT